MGNSKSQDGVKQTDGENGSSGKLPTHHLPFLKKKKKRSPTIRRLVGLFNKKKPKIKISHDQPNNNVYLGHKNKNGAGGNFTSYCSPYLLLQDNSHDPLANFWPPLLHHSHLSLLQRVDDDQLSKINVFDMEDDRSRKASIAEQDMESMVIHDVYTSVIQQATERKLEVVEEVPAGGPSECAGISSRSGSNSSSSGTNGAITCSSGRGSISAEGEFEDACSSFTEKKQAIGLEDIREVEENNKNVENISTDINENIAKKIGTEFNKVEVEVSKTGTKVNQREVEINKPEIKVTKSGTETEMIQKNETKACGTEANWINTGVVATKTEGELSKMGTEMSKSGTKVTKSGTETSAEMIQKNETKASGTGANLIKTGVDVSKNEGELSKMGTEMSKPEAKMITTETEISNTAAEISQSEIEMSKTGALVTKSGTEVLKPGTQEAETKTEKGVKIIEMSKSGIEVIQSRVETSKIETELIQTGNATVKAGTEMGQIETAVTDSGAEMAESVKKSVQTGTEVNQNRNETGIEVINAINKIGAEVAKGPESRTEVTKTEIELNNTELDMIQSESAMTVPGTAVTTSVTELNRIGTEMKALEVELDKPEFKLSEIKAGTKSKEISATKLNKTDENIDKLAETSIKLSSEDVKPPLVPECRKIPVVAEELISNRIFKVETAAVGTQTNDDELFKELSKEPVKLEKNQNLDKAEHLLLAPKIEISLISEVEDKLEVEKIENERKIGKKLLETNLDEELELHLYENVLKDDDKLIEKSDLEVKSNSNVVDVEVSREKASAKEGDESSLSESDGDKESSCDGSESSVMEIGDEVWDEDGDELEDVDSVAEAAVNIKTKLVLDLLNQAEVDMEDFNAFLHLPCPVEDKYHFLQVQKLFDANQIQDSSNLDELGRCFRVLSRYGLDLLKPVDERPLYWEKILLPMETPTCRWLSVQGAQEILLEFGYQRVESGLVYPEEIEPDAEAVAAWVVELLLAAHELSCFSLQAHPHPDLFKRSLTTSSSSIHAEDDQLPSTSCQSRPPVDTLKKSTSAPLICKESETGEMIGRRTLVPWLNPSKDTSRPLPAPPPTAQPPPPPVPPPQRCHLCGSSSPAVRCEKCSNLIFCLSCDDMYHRHPKRRDHVRKLAQRPPVVNATPPPRPPPKITDLTTPPVPPPRRRKSQLSAPSSPVGPRKNEQKLIPELPKKQFPLKFGSLKKLLPNSNNTSNNSNNNSNFRAHPMHVQIRAPEFTHPAGDHRKGHLPFGRANTDDWSMQPMEPSSSEMDDEEEDGRSTGTSSGGPAPYLDEQWAHQTLPPRFGSATAASRSMATLERQSTGTLLRHHHSFNAPNNMTFAKQERGPYMYNHSASVMDLSYPHPQMGYPLPQVQSMSEGLDFSGGISPCGCRLHWIGPDHLGGWLPPVRCPMHSSTSAMFPSGAQPPWPYPPYLSSPSPPPPQLNKSMSPPLPNNTNNNHQRSRSSREKNGRQKHSSSEEDEPMDEDEIQMIKPKNNKKINKGRVVDVKDTKEVKKEVVKMEEVKMASTQMAGKDEEEVEEKQEDGGDWECEHCTFINEKDTRICAVCCKTKGLRDSPVPMEQEQTPEEPTVAPVPIVKKEPEGIYEEISTPKTKNHSDEIEQEPTKKGKTSPPAVKHMTSTGTSPPPQTISTQTEMWSSDEQEAEMEDEEEMLRSPSPVVSAAKRRIKNLKEEGSRLRRAASLQTVNRRSTIAGSRDNWQHDHIRRTASRASLRDTSSSPPPTGVSSGRQRRRSTQSRRRTSTLEHRTGYSSREEERGDDEYDFDDEDDKDDVNWSRGS